MPVLMFLLNTNADLFLSTILMCLRGRGSRGHFELKKMKGS